MSSVPLSLCFVDLQKVHDAVGRTLLSEEHTRFEIPPKMITIVRMFLDGMRARVQLDDCELSARFRVRRGLRQFCVSSPLLFNVFGTALVDVIVRRFAADTVTISDLVLDDAPKSDDDEGLGVMLPLKVPGTVWGTLWTEDA